MGRTVVIIKRHWLDLLLQEADLTDLSCCPCGSHCHVCTKATLSMGWSNLMNEHSGASNANSILWDAQLFKSGSFAPELPIGRVKRKSSETISPFSFPFSIKGFRSTSLSEDVPTSSDSFHFFLHQCFSNKSLTYLFLPWHLLLRDPN